MAIGALDPTSRGVVVRRTHWLNSSGRAYRRDRGAARRSRSNPRSARRNRRRRRPPPAPRGATRRGRFRERSSVSPRPTPPTRVTRADPAGRVERSDAVGALGTRAVGRSTSCARRALMPRASAATSVNLGPEHAALLAAGARLVRLLVGAGARRRARIVRIPRSARRHGVRTWRAISEDGAALAAVSVSCSCSKHSSQIPRGDSSRSS